MYTTFDICITCFKNIHTPGSPSVTKKNKKRRIYLGVLTKQIYDLNIRKSRVSVTILVRHRGHSREEVMMRSEHPRHNARCLPIRSSNKSVPDGNGEGVHIPAVYNCNIGLFILTYDTQSASFSICGLPGRGTTRCRCGTRG